MLAGPIKIDGQATAYALPPLLGEHNWVLAECAPSGRRRNVRPGRSTRKKASDGIADVRPPFKDSMGSKRK